MASHKTMLPGLFMRVWLTNIIPVQGPPSSAYAIYLFCWDRSKIRVVVAAVPFRPGTKSPKIKVDVLQMLADPEERVGLWKIMDDQPVPHPSMLIAILNELQRSLEKLLFCAPWHGSASTCCLCC